MKTVQILPAPTGAFIDLVRQFQARLRELNNNPAQPTAEEARAEAAGYFGANRVVFGLELDGKLIGFSALKTEDGVYWLDWLFVDPAHRGFENASYLFDETERHVLARGEEQMYIWVHPDNHAMLKFLKKKGYDVLNLVEVKKVKAQTRAVVDILGHELRY